MTKVRRSSRENKKYMVVVDGEEIHFGATGYTISPGTTKGDSYCARSSGIKGANDKKSANYWARRAWGCEGKKSYASKAIKLP